MSDGSTSRCLVTGATGYIGGLLAPVLLDGGHTVRALARDPDKLRDAPWRDRAEVVRGDLGDVDSLTEAFDGVDVVYYLVHSMGTSSDFVSAEAQSARNVVTAAKQAGVQTVRLPVRTAPGREAVTAPAIAHRRRRHPHRVRHRDRSSYRQAS